MVARSKGRKTYRSMQGKVVDLDLLIKRNELTPAVGNAKVNARGDELGPGGQIIRRREEVVKEYYDSQPVIREDEQAPALTENEAAELQEFDEESVPPKPTPKKVTATPQPKKTVDQPVGEWVEDADGNFIRKGE